MPDAGQEVVQHQWIAAAMLVAFSNFDQQNGLFTPQGMRDADARCAQALVQAKFDAQMQESAFDWLGERLGLA